MKLLALDSSASAASVAIFEDEKLLGEFFINTKQTHSQTLMLMLQNLLLCTKVTLNEIDVFAVAVGPGSFTGVRIGVSCIKGLAFAENKPCLGVSTLQSMAYMVSHINGIVCSVMDARCEQVYNGVYKVENGVVTVIQPDRALSIASLAAELQSYNEPIYVLGDGMQICRESHAFQNVSAVFIQENLQYQRASGVGSFALNQLLHNQIQTQTAEELVPLYLRLPQAERELKKKQEALT